MFCPLHLLFTLSAMPGSLSLLANSCGSLQTTQKHLIREILPLHLQVGIGASSLCLLPMVVIMWWYLPASPPGPHIWASWEQEQNILYLSPQPQAVHCLAERWKSVDVEWEIQKVYLMEVVILVKCKEHLGFGRAKRRGRLFRKRKLEPVVKLGHSVKKE